VDRRAPVSANTRLATLAFAASTLAGLALAVVYVLGGQPQAEGALLLVSVGGIGVGIVAWAKTFLPEGEETEAREPLRAEPEARERLDEALDRADEIPRRTFLGRGLASALGALGLAAVFPVWSLGPSPGRTLFRTRWRPGARLVTEDGTPVKASDVAIGGVLTVFPEGATDASDSQVLLLHVDPARIRPRPGRETWSPQGFIAYSKICTHAGCPVGLFETQTNTLLCPCHQSTFDVGNGARPVFGPATRSLPQLPIVIDADGTLRAVSDFTEPVGPAFWGRS
jgi:ubiquinol-cytochrome c reductase iron-sulfur subunit